MATYRLGHTGITWPGDQVEQAVADVAALGYQGFETFPWTIESYPGGVSAFKALLECHNIPLVSTYWSLSLIDPNQYDQDLEKVQRWIAIHRALGPRIIILGASGRKKPTYSAEEYHRMVERINDVGRRALDAGLIVCFHPHTGTPVETREEIDRVMGSVNPEVVFFAPDVGQIAKGGGDPVAVVRNYSSLIRHVHLKDFVGGKVEYDANGKEVDPTGYLGYVPLGMGVVDIPGILDVLDKANFDGWLNVELDGTPQAPRPPKEAAAISKRYIDRLLSTLGQHAD